MNDHKKHAKPGARDTTHVVPEVPRKAAPAPDNAVPEVHAADDTMPHRIWGGSEVVAQNVDHVAERAALEARHATERAALAASHAASAKGA